MIPLVAAGKRIGTVDAHEQWQIYQTQVCGRSVLYCIYIWDHGRGGRECKTERGTTNQALTTGRTIAQEGQLWTLTSSLTFRVFTEEVWFPLFFPCSHTSRCEEGSGGKRVALSPDLDGEHWSHVLLPIPAKGPQASAIEAKHRHHLFYIKSVRLNKEANNLQLTRCILAQNWRLATLVVLVKTAPPFCILAPSNNNLQRTPIFNLSTFFFVHRS